MERDFHAWQARSAAHREAFEKCTDVWQDIPRIKLADAYSAASASRAGQAAIGYRRATWRWAAATGVAVFAIGGALLLQHWRSLGAYSTDVGEQRLVVLEDGTRVLLNTGTQVRAAFSPAQRSVEVDAGEALFEVAKDASRPFVVHVAGSEVVAVGTAFAVRFIEGPGDADALAVTLIEGQVSVRPVAEHRAGSMAPDRAVQLRPGDRLLLDQRQRTGEAGPVVRVDRPNVEQVTAWKRREAVFQAVSIADAVAEMNRYSRTPIVLADAVQAEKLHVSGVFRTGDNAGFARAVAAVHGLTVRDGEGRLELTKIR
jgi:transmembrane sensor